LNPNQNPVRLLVIIEAASVTGPVKNLLGFCQWTRSAQARAQGVFIEPILATYIRGGASNAFIDSVRKLDLPLHLLPEAGPFDFSLFNALRQLTGSLQPHILQTHNVKTNFLIKAAGLHRIYPWISFQHGYTSTNLKMLAYNQLDRWSLPSANRVVTVCQAFTGPLIASGVSPSRLSVLHNSVSPFLPPSPQELEALALRFGLKPQETILLTVGRFSREKGHADLIEALAKLRAQRPEGWRAVLVGEGPELPRLQSLISRYELSDRIVFAGFHSSIAPWLGLAGVFVLPSLSEGSPNVILEAMAAGVPIAATRAGGTPEIITHDRDALLSPVSDPTALANNIERLLAQPSLAQSLAHAALQTATDRFSPDSYRSNLVAIYRQLLSGPSASSLGAPEKFPPDPSTDPVPGSGNSSQIV
jgi:glycosyltransferase involved in cell wall biosynthesis